MHPRLNRKAKCHPDRPHKCRGMCSACYQRYKASGNFVKQGKQKQATTCGHDGQKVVGNGLCKKCYTTDLRRRHGESGRLKRKTYYLGKKYGLSYEQYSKMIVNQDNKCRLCLNEFKVKRHIHVDHCHDTGQVRGIICFKCNQSIGKLGDTIESLERVVRYLKGIGEFLPPKAEAYEE